ncbi:MAG: hypothetical protein GY791_15845 [Alphaproteobacteria bacterium]|nr:hypothetical protein [Alphaproteobacteria bacterium]
MITSTELAQAIQGTWRLARLDPGGMALFDISVEGFWRSFWAAALVAPAYLLLAAMAYDEQQLTTGLLRFYTVEAIGYVIGWTAFPVAMFYFAELIDRSEDFVGYIVAYNWSHILQTAVFLPVALLTPNDPAAPSGWSFLMVIATVVILAYVGHIAKTALRISGTMAAGVVILDLALSLFITGIKDALILG